MGQGITRDHAAVTPLIQISRRANVIPHTVSRSSLRKPPTSDSRTTDDIPLCIKRKESEQGECYFYPPSQPWWNNEIALPTRGTTGQKLKFHTGPWSVLHRPPANLLPQRPLRRIAPPLVLAFCKPLPKAAAAQKQYSFGGSQNFLDGQLERPQPGRFMQLAILAFQGLDALTLSAGHASTFNSVGLIFYP